MSQGQVEKFERDCDRALGWIARFRSGSVSDADREAFALWLGEDPDHGRAMDRMQDLWDDLGSLRHLPEPELPPSSSRRQWLGLSLAAAASLLLALFFLPQRDAAVSSESYRTALGERRTVSLSDGSRITLNTDSRITVRLAETGRAVALKRGEAFFEVAPDTSRPFRVDAGPARVTVVGTAFNVYRRDNHHSEITVAEGVVRVTKRDSPATRAPSSEILHANQRLEVGREEGLVASAGVDVAPRLAWRRGELVARQMPLTELAKEMARYHDRRILITDPEVAALTVSGVFQLDHPDAMLEALERSLGLRVVPVDERTVQLLPAAQ